MRVFIVGASGYLTEDTIQLQIEVNMLHGRSDFALYVQIFMAEKEL
mgnify:CR=1 FL=1|jgi:hypothetical protein